jgi:tetraacyldisaccharide 4'-kinase
LNTRFWSEVVEGQGGGITALCLRPVLILFSLFYRLAVCARNTAYDLGILRGRRLPHQVISVGNIVAGGTGKTPFVRLLVTELQKRGMRVAVLSRGYGAVRRLHRFPLLVSDGRRTLHTAMEAGDETVMLARSLGAAIVIADPSRLRAGTMAEREFAVDCFILDDGFQHRKLRRDVDILLLDCDRPFANGRLLPAGYLREPARNISRANLLIITRCESAPARELLDKLTLANPRAAIFSARYEAGRLVDIESGVTHVPGSLRGKRIAAFSAIARPDDFEKTLSGLGVILASRRAFPDHHFFDRREMEEIIAAASRCGAEAIVTTAKDAVRLPAQMNSPVPFYYLDIEMRIGGGEDKLIESVLQLLNPKGVQGHKESHK